MSKPIPVVLTVRFFATDVGNEPVREWIKLLDAKDRRTVGEDVKTVQIGWPMGMPLVRKMGKDLFEVRITLRAASRVSCSPSSTGRWSCFMASSRNRKRRRKRIWTSPKKGFGKCGSSERKFPINS
jgi:hypothetical protein